MPAFRHLCVAVAVFAALVTVPPVPARAGIPPPPMYPGVGRGTHLVDHSAKLTGFVEPEWYEANIPFVDLPDKTIEDTYYYRSPEGRWLRDSRYLDDYIDYWLRGSGSKAKPATEALNPNTTDWAHEYSFWAADAVLARASVDGRWAFAANRLPELQRQWAAWSPQFDQRLGLYWQVPVWDAMEYSASSYQSPDPYHGGAGFRPK